VGHTILAVDDDLDLLRVIEDVLEDEGYTVLTARSGRDALTMLAVSSPDVVLTDVTMPGLDGLSFVDELRHRDAAPPVVLMSGVVPTGLRDIPLLRKPFDIAELLEEVERALGTA
jgi:CheY-like chemotaxis protein